MDGLVTLLTWRGGSAGAARSSARTLLPAMLRARARRLRLVLTDCDGVLTDGTAWYGPEGEAFKRFSLRDGMGVERLRAAGIETAIVTRERSSCVARRAEKLRLPFHFEGVQDKAAHLGEILARTACSVDEVAYMGDDLNDLGLLQVVGEGGLTAAPQDAVDAVLANVHFRSSLPGGRGAFREFAEWILALREDA
jgi:3-deoxy-D-manno-octulosonate 8-phosphate phosphatase (KDO 8-P phosphatase)